MTRSIGWTVVSLVGMAACGPANTFSGSVQGKPFLPRESIFFVSNVSGGGQVMTVTLSDQTGLCTRAQLGGKIKSSTMMRLGLSVSNGQAVPQPMATGTFNVHTVNQTATGNVVVADFFELDASCNTQLSTVSVEGDSGTLTLQTFTPRSGQVANGNFAIGFGTDSTSGTFIANWCDLSGVPNTQSCN